MALCHVTGIVYLPDGTVAARREVAFYKLPDNVTADYLGAVVPEPVVTRTDNDGAIDVNLITGNYHGYTLDRNGSNRYQFKAVVPEAATADFSDLISAADPVVPLPAWLQQAIDARDRAEDAAQVAEDVVGGLGSLQDLVDEAEGWANAAQDAADNAANDANAQIAPNVAAAEAASNAAQDALAEAESARDAAFVNADVFADAAAGRAAVADGAQFQVVSGDEIIRYRRDSATAQTEVARILSAAAVASEFFSFQADLAVLSADFFVDPQTGNDANDGLSPATALRTLSQARAAAGPGATVALARGQDYLVAPPVLVDETLTAAGLAASRAVLDSRQSLRGNTWTDEGDGVYRTQITLASPSVSGGLGSNTTNFAVWFGDLFAQWIVGGADIAANIATLKAWNHGSLAFAINVTGSTQQDIRSAPSTTGPFDLYVKMPDATTPEGRGLKCSNSAAVIQAPGSQTFRGIKFIGGFGKDHVSFSHTNVSDLIDCEMVDFGEHGFVGPANLERYKARGRARPGATIGSAKGQSAGAGVNLYTSAFQPEVVLNINGADISDVDKGIYCHGSGNQGYRRLDVAGGTIRIKNARQAVWVDPVPTSLLPMFTDGIRCSAPLFMDDVEFGFGVDGWWEFTGGGLITLSGTPATNACTLASLRGASSYLLLKDFEVQGRAPNSLSFRNNLYVKSSTTGFPAPTVVLDNVRDTSARPNRLVGPRSTPNAESVHLVLRGNTQLQNLAVDAGHNDDWPASLTVEAGCTFGWGNRTGPDIVSALNALSIPNNISNQTTILNIDGSVASSPGW